MRLMPNGEKVRLCDMEPGLFLFGDCLALKTEYMTESGRNEAYIVDTGEFFHGGTKTAADQRVLMVQPLKVGPLVLCNKCRHWHKETGWCNRHSHFVGADGEACHPWESTDWKILHENDFCSYGVPKKFPRITEQAQAALAAMGEKAHGGNDDG